MRRTLLAALAALALLTVAVGSAVAAPGAAAAGTADADCADDDRGPGAGGPPAFVGDILGSVLPGFVTDLIASLPVPTFLKGLLGAC